jgi:hypothetical protein
MTTAESQPVLTELFELSQTGQPGIFFKAVKTDLCE